MPDEEKTLNDADVSWVKERIASGLEDTLHGVTNSEILWGGPRGPGLVYVVQDLVKATANLGTVTGKLFESEKERSRREAQVKENWKVAKRVFYWVVTPSVFVPFLRLVYTTITPVANAHGYHLPYLESGVKTAR